MPGEPLLGAAFRKAEPKLRMIANGKQEVNAVRSDFSSSICVAADVELDDPPPALYAAQVAARSAPKKTRMRAATGQTEASVFIERVAAPKQHAVGYGVGKRIVPEGLVEYGTLSTAVVPLDQLADILADEDVTSIELGQPLKAPTPVICEGGVRAPLRRLRRFSVRGGRRVLIGIIDVQGFDFAHADFLESGRSGTRFVRIWDQGGQNREPPERFGLNYGSEIHKQHMDAAIRAAPQVGLAPQELEPQSQTAPGSHGTHVASIAAGNRGVCRNALIAGVLVSLPAEDRDRRKSFYDSTRVAHAVKYLFDLADELRRENGWDHLPVSINISLGTNGHAHDGSSAVSRWIDYALTTPGRSVCVAAGNAGQEGPAAEDDMGFIMGRIHTSGRIPARGLTDDIEWLVVGNSIMDLSENELEIWYSPADRFAVSVKPPAAAWIGPIQPGEYVENRQLEDGAFVSIYNELYYPANGANYSGIYLSPFFAEAQIRGVSSGLWRIRLHGEEVRDGRYHGWIERDDPRRLGPVGRRDAWQFPSFLSQQSNVDDSSVSSLGCGHNVLCVANLDEKDERINISSSQGPTRDGRFKPDVCAPGTGIVAANGFTFDKDPQWIAMTGTSMASPFVAGVVGLMFAENPGLTAAQIGGIIQRTARPLPGADFRWRNDAGYGAIDPRECLAEVRRIQKRREVK
jgi:subtilisin family serine protease